MNLNMRSLLIFIVFLCFESYSSQVNYVSQSDGAWNTPSVWTPSGIPTRNDFVTIEHNITGFPGSNYTECATLNIDTDGTLDLNNSSYALRVFQAGTSLINNGNIINGYIYPVANITISGSGSYSGIGLNKQSGELYIDCDITFDKRIQLLGGADMYLNTGRTITMNAPYFSIGNALGIHNSGTIVLNDLDFNDAFNSINGDFIVNVSGALPNPRDGFNNLTLNAANTFEIGGLKYAGGNVLINGNLTISSNNTFLNDIDLKGNLVLDNSELTMGSNTISFNGTSNQSITETIGTGIANFNTLELDNPFGLTLISGSINILEVMKSTTGTITQSGANVTLLSTSENTAGLVKINTASDYNYLSGDFTVQRYYVAVENGWKMVAAPIQSATLADWNDEFIYCGVLDDFGNPVDYSYTSCGSFYSVYSYNELNATPTIDDGLSEVTSLSFGVSDATGTLIYTSGQTPSNPSGATTLSVTGIPEFRSFTKTITKDNDGWNLISNPYPATLDWENGSTGFYDVNSTRIDDAFYIYEANPSSGTARYKTITSGAQDIPHSQGFWVKKTSAGTENLTFNINQTIGTQPSFIKSNNGINNPLVIKSIYDSTGYFDDAEIKSASNYSSGFDVGKEIFKLFAPYPEYASNIYFIDNSLNELHKICINNNTSDSLFFDVRIGSYASGNYTLEFENLKQFMIGSCIQMEDLHNGVITDLRQDSIYNFVSDTNAPSPRFKLQINVDYDINVSNATCFQDSSATVSLNGSNLQGYYFNLIDTSGLLIDSVTAVSDSILFDGLNAGVFQYETNHVGTCPTHNQLIYVTEPEEVISLFSTVSDTFYLDTSNQISINFRNLSTGSTHYEWDLGDGNSSNNFSVYHTYVNPGTYNVKLTSKMDSIGTCIDEFEKSVYIIDPVSNILDEVNIDNIQFDVKNKVLHIKFENTVLQKNNISIIDIQGKSVFIQDIISDSQIDLRHLKSGMYLVNIRNFKGDSILQTKFIIN